MKKLIRIASLFSFIILSFSVMAQTTSSGSFDNTIKNLSGAAATGYVGPIIGSFGSNLNSGWVTKAPAATKFSFNLDIKIIAMGSMIDDAQKTFSTSGAFRFTGTQAEELLNAYVNNGGVFLPGDRDAVKKEILNQDFQVGISGPTIAGSGDERVKIAFAGQAIQAKTGSGQTYNIPAETVTLQDVKGFLDGLSIFPTAAIQLGIGTIYGTNFAVRWFPKVNIKDLGDFTYWGFGGMHNPAIWFNEEFPIDIAVGGFYQDMKVGTIFETKASMYGIYASKTLGSVIALTPYIGLTSESSTTTINYDYEYTDGNNVTQKQNVHFDLNGANSTGFTVGMAFKLAVLNLNIDYKFANIKTASAGLTFGF